MKDILNKPSSDKEARDIFRTAKSNYVFGTVFSGVGGFCFGYDLAPFLFGKEVNWPVVGIGAGLSLVTIPINGLYNNQSKKAVDLYNSRTTTAKNSFTEYNFGITSPRCKAGYAL